MYNVPRERTRGGVYTYIYARAWVQCTLLHIVFFFYPKYPCFQFRTDVTDQQQPEQVINEYICVHLNVQ